MVGLPRLLPMGPDALLVDTAGREPASVAIALSVALIDDVIDVVPAAETVLVTLRMRVDEQISERVLEAVEAIGPDDRLETGQVIEIPVTYDGADLVDVATRVGMTIEQLIETHSGADHRAAFCGFAPGFAYLELSDNRLHLPRRPSPRPRVPIGSVAIAAGYTAVYPVASPGGWHLIGTTEARMWDPSCDSPARVRPGDRVRFVPQ